MDEKPGKDRKAGRAEDRGQRDVAADQPAQGRRPKWQPGRPGGGDQKDSEAGGHALASAEAEPDGEDVAEDGREGGKGLRLRGSEPGAEQAAEKSAEPDSRAAFEHIERKVAAPRPLPPARRTLVAPILPLPA